MLLPKNILMSIFYLSLFISGVKAMNDFENQNIISFNKELPHATLMVYPDENSAWIGNRFGSPYFKSLNGKWKFHWVNKPADRPEDFYKGEYNVSWWKEIDVPGNWQPVAGVTNNSVEITAGPENTFFRLHRF